MEKLCEVLMAKTDLPSIFAVSGSLKSTPLPGLHVNGVGPVSVPLCEEQAKKIISVCSKAPYGRGEKTILDESYRKTWQLQPEQISIKNELFEQKVQDLVLKVRNCYDYKGMLFCRVMLVQI